MELASILNVNLVYVSHFQLLHQPATAVLNLGTADVLLVQQLGLFLFHLLDRRFCLAQRRFSAFSLDPQSSAFWTVGTTVSS